MKDTLTNIAHSNAPKSQSALSTEQSQQNNDCMERDLVSQGNYVITVCCTIPIIYKHRKRCFVMPVK